MKKNRESKDKMLHTKTYLHVHVYFCGIFYHFIPYLQCNICISFIIYVFAPLHDYAYQWQCKTRANTTSV